MKSVKREGVAYFSLTLMTLIVGFSFIFVKIALRHASPIDLLAHRFSAAFVGIFLYYLIRGKGFPRYGRESILSLLLLSLFYPILLFLLQTVGLQFTTCLLYTSKSFRSCDSSRKTTSIPAVAAMLMMVLPSLPAPTCLLYTSVGRDDGVFAQYLFQLLENIFP